MQERWKAIKDFPNYEVSNLGAVRSIKRLDTLGRKQKGVVLKSSVSKGYRGVNLRKNNQTYYKRIHRLVAFAFCSGCESGLTVNHLDGDKANNTAENLEWCTQAENMRHAQETGLVPTSNKRLEADMKRLDKEERVDYIIELLRTTKLTQKEIAKKVDVTISTISRINSGERNRREDEAYPIRVTAFVMGNRVRKDYLSGMNAEEIAEKYSITYKRVMDYVRKTTRGVEND